MEAAHGLVGLLALRQIDEGEAARSTRLAIDRDADLRHCAGLREKLAKIGFRYVIRQVAHE
jgi:hypothetical protein